MCADASVHDYPSSCRSLGAVHVSKSLSGTEPSACKIDIDNVLPLLELHLLDRRCRGTPACINKHKINLTKVLLRPSEQFLYILLSCHVSGTDTKPCGLGVMCCCLFHSLARLFKLVASASRNDHVPSRLGERYRGRTSYSA